ncbi:uncharacterized protein LOC119094551 [Pollicipes pollicipes]|uniref:uncharacterized protein LOC119094551 n=1 Tax=Pollicipes pollicipes TaxID=41117 RepID=UPI0018856ED5|nr:uncharacterized protein LOC119094551 [Pollicipes pollicipes]
MRSNIKFRGTDHEVIRVSHAGTAPAPGAASSPAPAADVPRVEVHPPVLEMVTRLRSGSLPQSVGPADRALADLLVEAEEEEEGEEDSDGMVSVRDLGDLCQAAVGEEVRLYEGLIEASAIKQEPGLETTVEELGAETAGREPGAETAGQGPDAETAGQESDADGPLVTTEELGAAMGEARPRPEDAGATEADFVSNMVLPTPNRSLHIILQARQLLQRRRMVREMTAQYREQLGAQLARLAPSADSDSDVGSDSDSLASEEGAPRRPDLTERLDALVPPTRDAILPPTNMREALDMVHQLRLQNLSLQAELMRTGGEHLRRGRKKVMATITAERLHHLEKLETAVERVFTPSQIRAMSHGFKRNSVQWREEDFRRAVTLRSLCSNKMFEYVRNDMKIPLPSIETLKLRCPNYPKLDAMLWRALREPNGSAVPGRT